MNSNGFVEEDDELATEVRSSYTRTLKIKT